MRTDDGETVIGEQELASGFMRRGFSFIFPCDYFVLVHRCVSESRINLSRPSSRYTYCVFVFTLSTVHRKDTSPAPSRP